MRSRRMWDLTVPALVVTMLVAAASDALAGPRGPELGANRYASAIQPVLVGETDVDEFVGGLIAGEKLTVTLAAASRSELLPGLEIVDPDGNVVEITDPRMLRVTRSGRSVSLRNFLIPAGQTGLWTVRVFGTTPEGETESTTGEYKISFRQRRQRPLRLRRLAFPDVDNEGALMRDFAIPAVDGAEMTLTIASKLGRGRQLVTLDRLTDPSGNDVPDTAGTGDLADEATVRRGRVQLRRKILHTGAGDYTASVSIPDGTASYSVSAVVKPLLRSKNRRTVELTPLEVRLNPLSAPVRGVAGTPVTFGVQNLPIDQEPVVLFDDVPVTVSSFTNSSITIVPPGLQSPAKVGEDGSTVAVTLIPADGQAVTQPDYFFYAPPPVITDLTTTPANVVIRGGSTLGGTTLRLVGTGFSLLSQVTLDGLDAMNEQFVSETELLFDIPAHAANAGVDLVVTDEFGRTDTAAFSFEYKVPPLFASSVALDPPFGPASGSITMTVTGSGLQADDILRINGAPITVNNLGPTAHEFPSPMLAVGPYPMEIEDRVGTITVGPDFIVKAAPQLTSLSVVSGASTGNLDVPLSGGTVIRVTGTAFDAGDVFKINGNTTTITPDSATQFTFTAPSGTAITLDLLVTDLAGQMGALDDALRRVGFDDLTFGRLPTTTSVDDHSAARGAIGDLDDDGADDDVVLVSPRGESPGTRDEYTRILFGDGSPGLEDKTSTNFPSYGSADTEADYFTGYAVVVGDVDGSNGDDIVVLDLPQGYNDDDYGGSYGGTLPSVDVNPPLFGTYLYLNRNGFRTFTNNGSGTFTIANGASADTYPSGEVDTGEGTYTLFDAYQKTFPETPFGTPTAGALGDIDDDGDLDMVVSTDNYTSTQVFFNFAYVDFTQDPYYTMGSAIADGSYRYASGTRVLINELSESLGRWRDATPARLGLMGTFGSTVPSLHSHDIKLGDVDGDDDLDAVVTWDNPLTTSPYELYYYRSYGYAPYSATAKIATRVLENDGYGFFTDMTSTWMPAGSGQEFWQGHRLALADLDGDLDPDLVILHAQGIDAFQGDPAFTASALRILRNDTTVFVDVTSTAIPTLPTDSDDNFRGGSVVARDIDGDGNVDIVIGAAESLTNDDGDPISATRLLLGTGSLQFKLANEFVPGADEDTGEVDDLLIGDFVPGERPTLLLLSEVAPGVSTSDAFLRLFSWQTEPLPPE